MKNCGAWPSRAAAIFLAATCTSCSIWKSDAKIAAEYYAKTNGMTFKSLRVRTAAKGTAYGLALGAISATITSAPHLKVVIAAAAMADAIALAFWRKTRYTGPAQSWPVNGDVLS